MITFAVLRQSFYGFQSNKYIKATMTDLNISPGMSLSNLPANAESCVLTRYQIIASPDSPEKSVPYHKFMSEEKPSTSFQMRQTGNLRKLKNHQHVESRPISLTTYNPNAEFFVGSNHSQQLQPVSHAKMMPFNSSAWVNNNKKVQKRWLADRQANIEQLSPQKKRRISNKAFFEGPQLGSGDLKQYFQSVKHYFNGNGKILQRNVFSKPGLHSAKKAEDNKDNLNIRQIRPLTYKAKRMNTYNQSQEFIQTTNDYFSTNFITKFSPQKRSLKANAKQREQPRSQPAIFKRKSTIFKQQFHYIFGGYKTLFAEEDVQKLKNLYFRDFLWKIAFNRGLTFEVLPIVRFYVGKGNNSRLIRKIMAKRNWWIEDSKPENAQFLWTQLKIYDVYKNQGVNKPKAIQKVIQEQICNQQQTPESQKQKKIESKQDKNRYILNGQKYELWKKYIKSRNCHEKKPYQDMSHRKMPLKMLKAPTKITNHIQFSRVIGNKKALYRTIQAYFSYKKIDDGYIPLTFHITGGLQDDQYLRFLRDYYRLSKQGINCWIVKPGELSNRGQSIKFCKTLADIKKQIKEKKINENGSVRTYILQSYIDRPLLYQGRKFDLRHYLMITSTQGSIRGYFYQQGYVRTTGMAYSLQTSQPGVHLTNDAVQKYLPQYSKFQKANKLSYKQLHQYMLKMNPAVGFYDKIWPQIRAIATQIIEASYPFIDPNRRSNNFQIFGIDIMIDQNYKCWLIQVNTNPCIEVNCKVLADVIPAMLDNAFTIGLDSLITPPLGKLKANHENMTLSNKFQLVFDQQINGKSISQYYRQNKIELGNYGDDDQNFESCDQDQY